jgi:hypothetical protein
MNKFLQILLSYRVALLIFGFILAIYAYGTFTGTRLCNCSATEKWKPGTERGARHVGGSRFYHK